MLKFTICLFLVSFNLEFPPSRVARCGLGDAKAELSEPTFLCRREEDHQIKVTPGITGWSPPRVHIDEAVRHSDVGSAYPGAEAGSKGWAVRPLKRHASWVQTVVRQVGPYLPWALSFEEILS